MLLTQNTIGFERLASIKEARPGLLRRSIHHRGTARQSRNQKEKPIFTTKVAKITKFEESFIGQMIRILRDLRVLRGKE